jgi:hypothetical protein
MKSLWIHGPATDLVFFGWGWLAALGAFAGVDRARWGLLFAVVLFFNFLHRHLTFPLVYGDPEQFRERKRVYVALPFLLAGLTVWAWFFRRPVYTALVAVAVLWTIFHTIMQKVGLLRIYGRKAGTGSAAVDRTFVWSWFAAVVLHLGSRPEVRAQAAAASPAGRWLRTAFESAPALLPSLTVAALAVALGATALLLRGRFSVPRVLYALSLLALYAGLEWDLIAGYAAFSFSHAIEYLAFASVYAGRKHAEGSSLLARAAQRPVFALAGFVVVVGGGFLLLRQSAPAALHVYIVSTGFLHFLYDGWIWKVRRPEVARPLGLEPA